jgi:hypothetical protein
VRLHKVSLVLTSSMDPADHYHAITQEMKLSDDGASYTMIDNCTVDFELAHANKGFEGIQYHEQDGGALIQSCRLQSSEQPARLQYDAHSH